MPRVVAQRKRWDKFGDVAGEGEGPNRANTQIADEVFLTLTTNREVKGKLGERENLELLKCFFFGVNVFVCVYDAGAGAER